MNELRLAGYSSRAQRSDLLEAMKKAQIKNFKITGITALVLLLAMLLIGLIVGKRQDGGIAVLGIAMLLLAVMMLTIIIVTGINAFFDIRRLKKDPIECKVIQNKKYIAYEEKGRRRTKY